MITYSNFTKGRMNKSVDERLLPAGEYVDAMNVRLGSTETTEIGSVENSKGNSLLATPLFQDQILSTSAVCIGAFEDGANETLYWFLHDPANGQSSVTNKVDLIVSFDISNNNLTYHVISTSVLNFSTTNIITGINKIGDLLFFTDDNNPPRKINVTRSYPTPVNDIDVLTNDLINVIVRPPVAPPTYVLLNSGTEENYLESRMVSFAYRYQYQDDEYSALSQFTDIAFVPGAFSLNVDDYTNEGMLNIFNTVEVSINTGPIEVKAIDICFKFADSTVINVIDKFKKGTQGWGDNQIVTQQFQNSKIFTVLGSSELSRLYDNVPRKAKAQTVMANRLIYGNYVDGYNVNNQLNYSTSLVTKDILNFELPTTKVDGIQYTINPSSSEDGDDSAATIDFTEVLANGLKQGGFLSLSFVYNGRVYDGPAGSVIPTPQPSTTIDFEITLDQDYADVNALATSDFFKSRIGSEGTYIQTVANCPNGSTLTDQFNCSVTASPTDSGPYAWQKEESGITGIDQGILITSSPGSNIIQLQFPAMQYKETTTNTTKLYGYFKITTADADFINQGNNKSLHSNRNYEVGIVYMDEYLRSSTALVSPNNTIFVPASNSVNANSIQVTIPTTMIAPSWATRYKFVCKRSEATYETIYSNIFYRDTLDNSVYFKLEGQNQTKAVAGDELVVKTDVNGPLSTYVTATILEVEAKAINFITTAANASSTPFTAELAGLYMKIIPNNFAVTLGEGEENNFDSGRKSDSSAKRSGFPQISIPCFTTSPDGTTVANVEVPEGSRVTFDFTFNRNSAGGATGSRKYLYNRTVAASQDYDNLRDFVIGENITFKEGISSGTDNTTNVNEFFPALSTACPINAIPGTNQYSFKYDQASGSPNKLQLCLSGGTKGSRGERSKVNGRITIAFASSPIIFETVPVDVDNDIYYENDQVFDINTNGEHQSGTITGDQNQTSSLPGIVNLDTFDCFSFGNGVESYKVEDRIDGYSFELGQRVTAVSEEDFKEANRFAGLTYSGVFNEETNINRTNEFNLSVANFKDLEKSFGDIQVLHSRDTNILVLQEDKISYVLANKNLLSDSASGDGAVVASAAVLGTQIARIEEFGISNNPESFVSYGPDRFFADSKRGAIIHLKGNNAINSDKLSVVSETGMRSYFRDLFNNNFSTQKLGGYDPYMNEYVFSSNETIVPGTPGATTTIQVQCGTGFGLSNFSTNTTFQIELGEATGSFTVFYNVTGSVVIDYAWSSTTGSVSAANTQSSFSIVKSSATPSFATITVRPTGTATFTGKVDCPSTNSLTIVQVTIGNPPDENKFIHNEYYWSNGSTTSPVSSELISFGNVQLSSYISNTGQSSVGLYPPSGATLYMASNKIDFDTLVFDPTTDSFKYLVSNTLYTAAQIPALLNNGSLATATPITNPSTGYYTANFTYTNSSNQYLYLIFDYTTSTSASLRYGASAQIACCTGPSATFYLDADTFALSTAVYSDSNLTTKAANQFYQADGISRQQISGLLTSSQACPSCGTAIGLCYSSSSEQEVCCEGCTYSLLLGGPLASSRTNACAGSATGNSYYFNGSGSIPAVNNFLYTNSAGTILASTGFYKISATRVLGVNANGMITEILNC